MEVHFKNMAPFRQCIGCNTVWPDRDAFLCDSNVMLVGYQANFEDLVAGLFLFNHSCETTLSMPVVAFRDLYDGSVFQRPLTGTAPCPEYCLRQNKLESCPAKCECAFVREIIQVVRNWPKTG